MAEAPLVAGVADAARAAGIWVGAGAEGAQMEGSKKFSKELMARAGIPTAAYGSFTDEASALAYVREQGAPIVVKADGLAAGKGVIVAATLEEAEDAVRECFQGAFGAAGSTVVVEECLTGAGVLPPGVHRWQDRAAHGDGARPQARPRGRQRPNTGGMGVYSPVPIVTEDELSAMSRSCSIRWPSSLPRASTTAAASTAASCSPRMASRCSSSMLASAIPRRR